MEKMVPKHPAYAGLLFALILSPAASYAQQSLPELRGQQPSGYTAGSNRYERLSEQELRSLLAPIALFPDSLLSHVLIASTYPLELVEADRWLKKQGKKLSPSRLRDELNKQDWDASIKRVLLIPEVLEHMSDDLDWSVTLGDALLRDRESVIQQIQVLRWKAYNAGKLATLKGVSFQRNKRTINIDFSNKSQIFFGLYDSWKAYGRWPSNELAPVSWYEEKDKTYVAHTYFIDNSFYSSRFDWPTQNIILVRDYRHLYPSYNRSTNYWEHDIYRNRGFDWREHRENYFDRNHHGRYHDDHEMRATSPAWRNSPSQSSRDLRDWANKESERYGSEQRAHEERERQERERLQREQNDRWARESADRIREAQEAKEQRDREYNARVREDRERQARESEERERREHAQRERDRENQAREYRNQLDRERAERERDDKDRLARVQREHQERERADRERAERDRKEQEDQARRTREQEEREQADRIKADNERRQREQAETERRERDRLDRQRDEQERSDRDRKERERLLLQEAQTRAFQEHLERESRERNERERNERERADRERQDHERQDRERAERERQEQAQREQAQREQAQREQEERDRKAREEREREDRERAEKERKDREDRERKEREERERFERERQSRQ